MDVRKALEDIVWIKPWRSCRASGASPEAVALVRACADLPAPEPHVDLQDLIARSKAFPIPFPIDTIRVSQLRSSRPAERLRSNAADTYPVLHERVLWLIADFLLYKREYGSSIEKELYKDMTIPEFVDRLLQKRAATFMKAQDQYKLLSGETGSGGWEEVGTELEKAPLLLRDCLSYDEMKISALVCVSGPTECVNAGARRNAGVVSADHVEPHALIIGIIGARFKRPNRMEYEDILVTRDQNTAANGYGRDAAPAAPARRAYRRLWEHFYQIPSVTYADLTQEVKLSPCTGARVLGARWAGVRGAALDNEAYARRVQLGADVVLLEAAARAQAQGAAAFVNVVGAGLGIWKHSIHQVDVFVLAVLARAAALLDAGRLAHVADVNFAYVQPKREVLELFKSDNKSGDDRDIPKLFLKNDSHPRGGISVQLENREPSARLGGAHAGKLLVLTYPWDSNAHPGNEFWVGKLCSSGDSAAACATQVAELHNAHVNPALSAARMRVATDGPRPLLTLQAYCAGLAGDT